jgi:hypothetical protein
MPSRTPSWAGSDRLPTSHAIRAAIHVASIIDPDGSYTADTEESYWHRATGGIFGPPDLRLGERLLLDCHLIVERELTFYPLRELQRILDGSFEDAVAMIYARAAELAYQSAPGLEMQGVEGGLSELIADPARREELLVALGQRFDDTLRRLVGAIGEEVVVVTARGELEDLGHADLARAVRHVSLETDRAGYDVSAPRIIGSTRLLEVKATSSDADELVFHLSRNEAETGLRFDAWALVVCRVTDIERRKGEIVGWCTAAQIATAFPADSPRGRWEAVAIRIACDDLMPGLPSAVD